MAENLDFRKSEPEYELLWDSYQQRIHQEREYFEKSTEIEPQPGFCYKTQIKFPEENWTPVVVNICSHFRIPEPRVENVETDEGPVERYRVPCSCSQRYEFEHEGSKSYYFIVVFHSEQVKTCMKSEEEMGFVSNLAAEKISKKEKAEISREKVHFCKQPFIGLQPQPDPQRIMKANNLIQEEGVASAVPTLDETSKENPEELKEARSKRIVQPVLSVISEDGEESVWDDQKKSSITHFALRLHMPLCKNAQNIDIQIENNTLHVEELEHGYDCKFTFPLEVKEDEIEAKFLKKSRTLQLIFEVQSRMFEFWRNALKLDEDALINLVDVPIPLISHEEILEVS